MARDYKKYTGAQFNKSRQYIVHFDDQQAYSMVHMLNEYVVCRAHCQDLWSSRG